jgi:hypothetical protein
MISWLETTTAAVSKIDTFSSSASGTYLFIGQTRSSTSSTSGSRSENWYETYENTTAYYRSFDGTDETLVTTKFVSGSALPNSQETTFTITATKNQQTSTTIEDTYYPVRTITQQVESSEWTSSSYGTGSETKISFYTQTIDGTITTTDQTESTYSAYVTTTLSQTVYDVSWHNTIYEARPNMAGDGVFLNEVLFSASTTDAANYLGPIAVTGASATRLTGTFNTETVTFVGQSSFPTQTDQSLAVSFSIKGEINVGTTITVASFNRAIPQTTRTLARTTRSTGNFNEAGTYFESATVSPAQQSTVWFVSRTKQTTAGFGLVYDETTTALASVTRNVVAPHFSIPQSQLTNGASRGVSVTTTAKTRHIVTTYQDRFHVGVGQSDGAEPLRVVYGPYGRSANSVGAAFSFPGITQSFTVPESYEAIIGREPKNTQTTGSVFGLMPGYYTYKSLFPDGSASLSLSKESFSFTTIGTESSAEPTITSGVVSVFGPSYVVQKIQRSATFFSNDESFATNAANLNLAGYNIIGGALAESETAVEKIFRGVWHDGSVTSFFDGAVTTRTSNVPTSAFVPVPYFFPELNSVTKWQTEGNNLIWASTFSVPLP